MGTKIINLYAGPGAGKSTTAAKLFVEMKNLGYKVELVQEYIKTWAWNNKPADSLSFLHLMGAQSDRERALYNKVDYIITDTPLSMMAVYDLATYSAILEFKKRAKEIYSLEEVNIFIKRNKPYYNHGRFQSSDEAQILDSRIKEFLIKTQTKFVEVKTGEIEGILNSLQLVNY